MKVVTEEHYIPERRYTDNMKYKPYTKILVINDFYGCCAIYEPSPFRKDDNDWCWVYYDWCGNPVGISGDPPCGELVDKFTAENIGSQDLADYLNKEPMNMTATNYV